MSVRGRWGTAFAAAVAVLIAAVPAAGVDAVPVPLNSCARTDNGDPVVSSVRLAPTSVDVTRGSASVTVTVATEDAGGPGPASGVSHVRVGLARAPGEYPSLPVDGWEVAHRDVDGLWRAVVMVPRGVTAGTWHPAIEVGDVIGWSFASYVDGLPESTDELSVTSIEDDTAPALTGLRFSRREVDTRREPQAVRVRARVHEAGSGVHRISVLGFSEKSRTSARVELRRLEVSDGVETWRGRMVVPRWVGTQTWRIHVGAADHAGNLLSHNRRELVARGLPGSLDILGGSDTTPPSITFQHVSPRVVDVTEQEGRVRVRVRVRDLQSGVGRVAAQLGQDDSGASRETILRRVSGTARDGVWRGIVPITRCWPVGGVGSIKVTASDRIGRRAVSRGPAGGLSVHGPDALAPAVASGDPLSIRFLEPVVGVSSTSAVLVVGVPNRVVHGAWTCRDAASTAVDCLLGPVTYADLHVEDPAGLPASRTVRLNPEHTLDVRDLQGNPFYRFDVSGGFG